MSAAGVGWEGGGAGEKERGCINHEVMRRKYIFFFLLFYLKSFHISDIRLILQLSCR